MSEYDSYDDEPDDYGIMKKALDVELPENFNPNQPPRTGEEYLHHVMYERQNCQSCVTVEIDRNKFRNRQTLQIQLENNVETVNLFLPTIEWQNNKLKDFEEFRRFIQWKSEKNSKTMKLDECKFMETFQKQPPNHEELIAYNQASKIRMVEIITRHIENLDELPFITKTIGCWLYGIFSLLEIPLHPSYCYTLREFCKRCRLLRSKLKENDHPDLAIPLNLFICLISRYFTQLDLADK